MANSDSLGDKRKSPRHARVDKALEEVARDRFSQEEKRRQSTEREEMKRRERRGRNEARQALEAW